MKKIDELKKYHIQTTGPGGIIMPTVEVFDTKIQLAIKLWPQVGNNGEINYLLGKGTGLEIALRGVAKGRKKYNNNFPYRSHSDFEIYGAKTDDYDFLPESEAFTYVFGSQEIFPRSKTKGLSNIPEDLMISTFQEVEYNGDTFLVPELELLFTDKYIARESTPRKEGYDALLLLEEYDLDLDRILYYYDNYFAKPQKQEIEEKRNPQKLYSKTIYAMENNLVSFVSMICEEEGIEMNLDILNKIANERLEIWRDFKLPKHIKRNFFVLKAKANFCFKLIVFS